MALAGIILFFLAKEKPKYFIYYLLGTIPWMFVMAGKLEGHNYHQYPLLPLVAFSIAYAMYFVAGVVEGLVKKETAFYVTIFILMLTLVIAVQTPKDRMFDVQFPGLDIAGEYIKNHSYPDSKIFFPSRQSYGVLWYADRKGFKTPLTEEELVRGEEDGANWAFVYAWGFYITDYPKIWGHFQRNYHVEQVAYIDKKLLYVLLKKGGSFTDEDIRQMTLTRLMIPKTYQLTHKEIEVLYSI